MAVKVGINGFGRIGRMVYRAAHNDPDIDIVAVNDLTDVKTLAFLLNHDSVHGSFGSEIGIRENSFVVNDNEVKVLAEREPSSLPWRELGVQVVVESTGLFASREKAQNHIDAGAKKVIITSLAKGDIDLTVVLGVNDSEYDPASHHIISNASCTTNCLAPVVKVLHDKFTIVKGFMTTIHSYTNDQQLLDLPHKDLRRARAAALSMIPTTTGAAKAVSLVIPEMKGKLDGLAIRIPTPNVSLVDLVVEVREPVTKQTVNDEIRSASENSMKGYLAYSDEPLVSSDFNGSTYSSIFDADLTKVIDGHLVKIMSWYDNEFGYASRVKDLIKIIGG